MASKFVYTRDPEADQQRKLFVQGFPGGTITGDGPIVVIAVGWADGGLINTVEMPAETAHMFSEFVREEAERVSRSIEEEAV